MQLECPKSKSKRKIVGIAGVGMEWWYQMSAWPSSPHLHACHLRPSFRTDELQKVQSKKYSIFDLTFCTTYRRYNIFFIGIYGTEGDGIWPCIFYLLCHQEILERAEADRIPQGVPSTLKFHQRWKRWKLEVAGSTHTFENRVEAVAAAMWLRKEISKLMSCTLKSFEPELSAECLKLPRTKDLAVNAVIQLRYKGEPRGCICCIPKAGQAFIDDCFWIDLNIYIYVCVFWLCIILLNYISSIWQGGQSKWFHPKGNFVYPWQEGFQGLRSLIGLSKL